MEITVFGASGGIGREVVEQALARGYNVRAFVRSEKRYDAPVSDGLTVVEGNIDDFDAVYRAVEGVDAVLWCVGIPLKRKYGKMASLEGHEIVIKAMEQAHVKRFIDWSTPSLPFEKDKRSFVTTVPGIMAGLFLTQAKKEIVAIGEMVKDSDLDWTIVRFMAPKDGERTGKVKVGFGDTKMKLAITRADIAGFMLDQIDDPTYVRSMPIVGS